MLSRAPYFSNHDRRDRFPWSLYHRELAQRLARAVDALGPGARVLVVGCGLEPWIPGAAAADCYGVDLDASAIELCRARHPALVEHLAVCPGPCELPSHAPFDRPFDAVVAKEVIEHVPTPEPWARALAARVAPGGELILTTPNYGRWSTLPLLERTVLEVIAWRDGYSRRDIHPTRFDRRRLEALDVGPGMELVEVVVTRIRWALLGRWRATGTRRVSA